MARELMGYFHLSPLQEAWYTTKRTLCVGGGNDHHARSAEPAPRQRLYFLCLRRPACSPAHPAPIQSARPTYRHFSIAQAISGLGSIGKTQLATEYAYLHARDYDAIFWARADTLEAVTASYSEIAALLKLPESRAEQQEITTAAVKAWLQAHRAYLLILDNADDLTLLPRFLPSAPGGHILITTRAWDMQRLATRLEVPTLPEEQ